MIAAAKYALIQPMPILKSDAIKVLGGGSNKDAAAALLLTPQALSQWPDKLGRRQELQVIGAAVRLHKAIPTEWRASPAKRRRNQ